MIPNNNLNPLPWYTELSDQNHRKEWAYGRVYPLICQTRLILPFQLLRTHLDTSPITIFKLIELNTGTETNITTEITESNLVIRENVLDGYDVILNYGKFLLPAGLAFKGLYYCEMTDGTNIWYSEVFNFVSDLSQYIKVVWYQRNEIFEHEDGFIDYNGGYQNFIYLATNVGKPDYPFEEEIQERDGKTFVEKQWSEKVYKFDFIAPEYMLDAMRIIRMHEYIWVQEGSKQWDVEQFLWEHEWQEQGDLSTVEAEFHTHTVVKKIGKGLASLEAGDFNDDFNNDFSGGEGEGGEPYEHKFYFMTGSIIIGVGNFVRNCQVEVRIKSSGELIDTETTDFYQYIKTDWGKGIEYEITVNREGYFEKVFDFINGTPGGTTNILLDENPATIYYSLTTGGVDSIILALIPNVQLDAQAESTTDWVLPDNTGATGTTVYQLKKGIFWTIRYQKAGYNTVTLDSSESDAGRVKYRVMTAI